MRKLKRRFSPCEMCGNKFLTSRDNNVCNKCDVMMQEDERKYFAKLEQKQKKRNCRSCDKVLPVTRYYRCEECLPDSHVAMDDAYVYLNEACAGMTLWDLMIEFKNITQPAGLDDMHRYWRGKS
jgi:hypothetical protein